MPSTPNTKRAFRDLGALTVLALLSEQPRHPYEVQRLIRDRRKDFVDGSPRRLYHRVDWLVRRGLIEVADTGREGRRPERTVYRITDPGRDELQTWLTTLLSTPLNEDPLFSAAISFLGYLPVEAAIAALDARMVALEGDLAGADASLRALRTQLRLPRVVLLEHEYGQALRRAELQWVRSLIDDVRAGRLAWAGDADFAAHRQRSTVGSPEPVSAE
ncbi:MAG: PadR family transcriptional regulator [Candidatus Dormibacteraeota bacterium]|nr:PadR family transcriptional regulator [Candidatus Dormibacteraeota bacterium]